MATTIKAAKRMVEKERPEVWDILEEVIREHPVLLNRAPTLHRLGIQAFEPVLIEGKAIQLHPLVCTAFNADFDGDQMAVHVPLSLEAQLEARVLMMSTNNILSPGQRQADHRAVAGHRARPLLHDDGARRRAGRGHGLHRRRRDPAGARRQAQSRCTRRSRRAIARVDDGRQPDRRGASRRRRAAMLLSEILPRHPKVPFELINRVLTRSEITDADRHRLPPLRPEGDGDLLPTGMMALGFSTPARPAFRSARTIWSSRRPRHALVAEAQEQVKEYEQQYQDGLITQGEKYNKVVDAWTHVHRPGRRRDDEGASRRRQSPARPVNSVYMMAHSGARGSAAQMKQLAGMRGLMAKPSGEIIETPIISNFKEGLTVLEYFNSTHGARKGLADTALKTANSGYLTRRLVDVAQDCIIIEDDCGTDDGLDRARRRRGRRGHRAARRAHARPRAPRTTCSIRSTDEVLVKAGELIDEDAVEHDRGGRHRGGQDPLGADLRDAATASAASATGATWRAARRSTSARRSASSPRSRSASRAPS